MWLLVATALDMASAMVFSTWLCYQQLWPFPCTEGTGEHVIGSLDHELDALWLSLTDVIPVQLLL